MHAKLLSLLLALYSGAYLYTPLKHLPELLFAPRGLLVWAQGKLVTGHIRTCQGQHEVFGVVRPVLAKALHRGV